MRLRSSPPKFFVMPKFDVKAFDENRGFIMGATDTDIEKSNALIIATQDGGVTWGKVYPSVSLFEIT